MTLSTEAKLEEFITALRDDPNMQHCVAVNISIVVSGYTIEYDIRKPEHCKRVGYTMRNLKGDVIQ